LVALVSVGTWYAAAGIVFGALAGQASSHELVVAWRLTAWSVSAIAFAAHITYERISLSSSSATAALRTALAAGLGAFGLALAAKIQAQTTSHHFPFSAIVIWPLVTTPAAFVAAFIFAGFLARARKIIFKK
jgi:hypothetical protein